MNYLKKEEYVVNFIVLFQKCGVYFIQQISEFTFTVTEIKSEMILKLRKINQLERIRSRSRSKCIWECVTGEGSVICNIQTIENSYDTWNWDNWLSARK